MLCAPVRGHALGCARSPEDDLERLCLGHFSLSRPSPRFLLVCLPTQRFRGGGVPSLRLPPARPPPGHSAPHADKSASSPDPPEKSVLTPLPAPLRPQALKPHREGSARRRGRGVGLGGAGAPLRCPDLRLAGEAARAPIQPGLSHLRLASTATARCAPHTPTPDPQPGPRRNLFPSRAFQSPRAPAPASPAGRMRPAYVRAAPSKTTATLAFTPARKVTRTGKAVSK